MTTKLSQAKEHLSQAFMDLETAIFDKINQAKNLADNGLEGNEINSLQETLAEIGLENEELKKFKFQAEEVVRQVKIDLSQIRKIINQT